MKSNLEEYRNDQIKVMYVMCEERMEEPECFSV